MSAVFPNRWYPNLIQVDNSQEGLPVEILRPDQTADAVRRILDMLYSLRDQGQGGDSNVSNVNSVTVNNGIVRYSGPLSLIWITAVARNLGLANAGTEYWATDYNHLYVWSGLTWAAGPNETWNYVGWFIGTPSTDKWQLCDGSSVTTSTATALTTSITVPNLIGVYIKGGSSYTGSIIPATAPTLSGSPALTGSPSLSGHPSLGGTPTITIVDPAIVGSPSITFGSVTITGAPSVTMGGVTISGTPSVTIGGVTISHTGSPGSLTGLASIGVSIVGAAVGWVHNHIHPIDNLVANNGNISCSQPYDWNLHDGTIWYPAGTVDGNIPYHVHGTLAASSSFAPLGDPNLISLYEASGPQYVTDITFDNGGTAATLDYNLATDPPIFNIEAVLGSNFSSYSPPVCDPAVTSTTSTVANGLTFSDDGETHYHRITGNSTTAASSGSSFVETLPYVDAGSSGSFSMGTLDLDYTKVAASTPSFTWNSVGTLAGTAPSFTWNSVGSLSGNVSSYTSNAGTLAISNHTVSWSIGTLDGTIGTLAGTIGSLAVTAGTMTAGSNGEPIHMALLPYFRL